MKFFPTDLTTDDIGNQVVVPEPNETDVHQHSFTGTIIGFRGRNVYVEDQDGDVFEIEPERLTDLGE